MVRTLTIQASKALVKKWPLHLSNLQRIYSSSCKSAPLAPFSNKIICIQKGDKSEFQGSNALCRHSKESNYILAKNDAKGSYVGERSITFYNIEIE